MERIRLNLAPNLFALEYDRPRWSVSNLFLVPSYAFSASIIERRNPLGPNAERRGWIGCNLLIGRIPPDARIHFIRNAVPRSQRHIRQQYAALRSLQEKPPEKRGWTLDVLNVVRSLGKQSFKLGEVYSHTDELAALHPDNRHVRDKIRQQLQVLRDLHILDFISPGSYRLL